MQFYSESLEAINKNFKYKSLTLKKIENYITYLNHWNQKINLVGHKNIEQIIEKSLIDCLLVADYLANNQLLVNKKALDIGSGSGFPAIIIAIIQKFEFNTEGFDFHLIDSNHKKTSFLTYISTQLNLNIHIHRQRLENFTQTNFDWFISRATYSDSLALVKQVLKNSQKNFQIYLIKTQENKAINSFKIDNIPLSKKNLQLKGCLVKIEPNNSTKIDL